MTITTGKAKLAIIVVISGMKDRPPAWVDVSFFKSLHRQRHFRKILGKVSLVLHSFTLPPGHDVDRVFTGRQRQFVVLRGIETVLVADVLLELVDELDEIG